jgi:dTDP-glucose 4,6-dehydratase
MKYLVCGGAGFLGSHLCDALLKRGDVVVAIDNLLTGSVDNIKHLLAETRFALLVEDVMTCDLPAADGIFHLASPAAPQKIMEYPEQTIDVNGRGTERLQEHAVYTGAKFLYVSSMKVHGNCGRVQAYIEAKRAGEDATWAGKIARLASVYGPRMALDDSRVIPQFIMRALKNEPLVLWNGGVQRDSFCYVDDIVDFLLKYMDSDSSETLEAGDPLGITIRELAGIIVSLTGSKSQFEYRTVEVSQNCHAMPDIGLAMECLGWRPSTDLREGLAKTIEYYRSV